MGKENKTLLFGIQEAGVMHAVTDEFDIDTRFRMVKESGVYDYYDKTPSPQDIRTYLQASEKYDLPLLAGSWFYVVGRDESLLDWHLRLCKEFDTRVHNVQIIDRDVHGNLVSDEKVAELFLHAAEIGEKFGVTPCFEVHVNMWSEHFGRVHRVANLVEKHGVQFTMTLDHSHVIFKMDNPDEQKIQDMDVDINNGSLILDPFQEGSICQQWIDANYIRHAHARAAIPNGPINVWSKYEGRYGRGIQYPFIKPEPGQWHGDWREENLEPWKQVIRQLFRYHASNPNSRLKTISTEFIPYPDYGGGAKYSLFEHSIACARWLRDEWKNVQKMQ